MRVIITGGAGLIGSALVQELARHHDEAVVLSRNPELARRHFAARCQVGNVQIARWDGRTATGWGHLISDDCALVNLAGATPAHWRWTAAYRHRILESRLQAGEAIRQAVERFGPPTTLVQASAAGYYGDRGQEFLTEASAPGGGFRADVCRAWEASTQAVGGAATRHCILRTGFVLDAHTGIFPFLMRFACATGVRLGTGEQWAPWMHISDVAAAIRFLLAQPHLSGPFNLCAPGLAPNREFLLYVRRAVRRPAFLIAPQSLLRLGLGELSTVVLDSQRLLPQRLTDAGFQCAYPQLAQAIAQLLQTRSAR
jgi:uncharacterized protein (TIGR01777 family)